MIEKPQLLLPYSMAVSKCKELMTTDSSLRATAYFSEKKTFAAILRMKRAEHAVVKVKPTSLPLQCEKKLSLMLTIKAKRGFAYGFDIWGNIKNVLHMG